MAGKGWSFGALVAALKGAAFLDVGAVAGTVAAGDDSRFSGRLVSRLNYSTPGTFTLAPVAGAKWYHVRMGGGGGRGGPTVTIPTSGAGSQGGGGSAGSWVDVWIPASLITANQTLVVGYGAGVSGSSSSTVGDASTFGNLISCPGGLVGSTGYWGNASLVQFGYGASSPALPTIDSSIAPENIVVQSEGLPGVIGTHTSGQQASGPGAPSPWSNGGRSVGNGVAASPQPGNCAGGGGVANSYELTAGARAGSLGGNGIIQVEVWA